MTEGRVDEEKMAGVFRWLQFGAQEVKIKTPQRSGGGVKRLPESICKSQTAATAELSEH